jgi:hypothetical protein
MKNTTKSKKKRFFFHYYKAESKKQGRNVMTMHWEGACHMVNGVKTYGADVESHDQKRQPHCIMRGFASEIIFDEYKGKMIARIYA